MKMNRYPDRLRVPAQYEGSQRGNPLSEAVPDMLSYEELMDRLASKPLRPEGLNDMSSSERRTALTNLNNLFIPMDYMYAIYDTLYRAMLSSYSNLSLINMVAQQNDLFLGRQTKQFSTQAESCSILGVPGIGKTSTIRRCLHQIPQVIEHTEYRGEMLYCKQVLYLMVECPSDCSVKTLACSIFSALDQAIGSHYFDQFGKGGKLSVSAATTQIKILCMTHHIGLILVDEIQNAVTTAQKQHQVRPLVKFLVELTNDTSTGVCFIGTGLAEEIFAEQEHLGIGCRLAMAKRPILIWMRKKRLSLTACMVMGRKVRAPKCMQRFWLSRNITWQNLQMDRMHCLCWVQRFKKTKWGIRQSDTPP